MTLTPAWLDDSLVAGFLAMLIGVGWYFRREQRTGGDFLFAGRSMSGLPLGVSLVATLVSIWSYAGVPAEAYTAGCKLLVIPLALWCCLPLLTHLVLPLYYRLGIGSVYEYLELRYDARTRLVGSALGALWRITWLGAVLYAPCRLMVVWAGLPMDPWWMVIAVGAVTTLYTCLGGMKAVVWTTVVQAGVMAAGVVLLVVSIWAQLDGGPARVTQVALALGRCQVLDTAWTTAGDWTLWGAVPYCVLTMLVLFVADQVTAQRCLTARSLTHAQWSITWSCVGATIMIPALVYAGLALLAFYHDHPQSMRPIWVANVDHHTHRSVCDAQRRPLIAWSRQAITPENIERLVAEQRLLRPNTYEPFVDTENLVVLDDGVERVNIRQLAMRRPPPEGLHQGEVILNQRAHEELWPHFIASQTAGGVTGCLLAAVLAAAMCCASTGMHAVSTQLVIDVHRRLGVGRKMLARRLGKPVEQLDAADEVSVGRGLVVVVGVAATLLALAAAGRDDQLALATDLTSALVGPLLAVFLLGMLTRRTTATSAWTTLVIGTICTGTLAAVIRLRTPEGAGVGLPVSGFWLLTCSVLLSAAWGWATSFVVGRRQTREQLRGLVVGLGPLGVREPEEASIAIPESFE
jgi:Na+/proline symporter